MLSEAKNIQIDLIQKTIGQESRLLPNAAQVSIRDQDLGNFLETLDAKEKLLFINSIASFHIYLRTIAPGKEVAGTQGIWTNFVLAVLFGLIELIMGGKNYVPCYTYLKNYLDANKVDSIPKEVLQEWKEKYGSNEMIRIFFEKYVSDADQKEILKWVENDPQWRGITNIQSFIGQMLKYRNDFIHKLSIESIAENDAHLVLPKNLGDDDSEEDEFDIMIRMTNDPKNYYQTLSIDRLTHFILKGVFRRFDIKNLLKI